MTIRASVFIAASLDGFIARPDGSLDWLEGDRVPGEDYGYREFFDSVDALVLGRRTYQTVLGFGYWPYEDRRVVVLSGTLSSADLPRELRDRVSVSAATPGQVLAALDAEARSRVYVDGGRVIQSFLAAGLIDTLTLTRIPVLIGSGIPLFGPLPRDQRLEHLGTRAWPNGFVQSRYRLTPGRLPEGRQDRTP